MKYIVELETFQGPFDLLFHLIEKNEVDIYDIPILEITDQYIEYLETMKVLDLEVTSEFLVMASTLLEIKSRMLLPCKEKKEDMQNEEGDPRSELIKKLLEYKKFKEVANDLKLKEELQQKIFCKPREEINHFSDEGEQLMLEDIKLIDLFDAFNKIIKRKGHIETEINIKEIQRDEITIEESMEKIKEIIGINNKIKFDDLFCDIRTRVSIVVTFLAILELIKLKEIKIKQENNFEDIIIFLNNGQ